MATHPPVLQYRVPYADTDQMGVVYYANFMVLFERSRNEMLRHHGYSYKTMEEDGYRLPVIEAHCRYLKPALYDDLLELTAWAVALSPVRLQFFCEVSFWPAAIPSMSALIPTAGRHACQRNFPPARRHRRGPRLLPQTSLRMYHEDLSDDRYGSHRRHSQS
jgi:YbgC/YbaW family acyl-CoA thioester hydrolase